MGLERKSTRTPAQSRKRQRAHESVEYFARSLLILSGDDQPDTAINDSLSSLSREIDDPV